MRIQVPLLLFVLTFAISISGCETQPSVESDNEQEVQIESTDSEDEALSSESSLESISLDSISNTTGVFIENNGMCSEITGLPFQGDVVVRDLYPHDDEYYREISVMPLDSPKRSVSGGSFTALSPSKGDRLITTINENAAYYKVLELGYFGGTSKISITDDSEINGNKVVRKNDALQIDSAFNDADLDVVWIGEVSGNDYGIEDMIYSKEECSFTCGSYMGTNWIEEDVTIDNPCYLISFQDKTDLPVTKTKDGYFIIDTSELSTGKYVIASGNVLALVEII